MGAYECICEGVLLVYVRECMRVCDFLSLREYVYACVYACVFVCVAWMYMRHTYIVCTTYVYACAYTRMRVRMYMGVHICVWFCVF